MFGVPHSFLNHRCLAKGIHRHDPKQGCQQDIQQSRGTYVKQVGELITISHLMFSIYLGTETRLERDTECLCCPEGLRVFYLIPYLSIHFFPSECLRSDFLLKGIQLVTCDQSTSHSLIN